MMASEADVRAYWDSHPQGLQFLHDRAIEVGSAEFFAAIRPYMDCHRFPYIMARIEREAAQLQGRHLLEIGCGLGFDAVEFMRRGVRVTATDLTPVNVELARRHFALEGLTPEAVQVESSYRLSFAAASFDAIYSIGVFSHMDDPARAVREMHRVLKPGGRLIVAHVYRRPSLFHLLSRLGRSTVIEIDATTPPVTHFFSEAELRELFRDFRIEAVEREHYRLIPSIRGGFKGALFSHVLRPIYNLLPTALAMRYANKASVLAVKPG